MYWYNIYIKKRINIYFVDAGICDRGISNPCHMIKGTAFQVYNEQVTWYEARTKCTERGEQLANLEDSSRPQILEYLQKSIKMDFDIWIGLRKSDYLSHLQNRCECFLIYNNLKYLFTKELKWMIPYTSLKRLYLNKSNAKKSVILKSTAFIPQLQTSLLGIDRVHVLASQTLNVWR